jgi:hypothetical protein
MPGPFVFSIQLDALIPPGFCYTTISVDTDLHERLIWSYINQTRLMCGNSFE